MRSSFERAREFKVKVVGDGAMPRQVLRLSELQGLDVLSTPTWIFDQDKREVPWANREAIRAYQDGDNIADVSSTVSKSDSVKFYAMTDEGGGHTVHVVGPRRVLLASMRTRNASPADAADGDEPVTLIISPIELIEGDKRRRNAVMFHEIHVSDNLRPDRTIEISANDTPLDVIAKMLDELAAGFPVPAVQARLIRDVMRDGADINQPVMFAKSFTLSVENQHRRDRMLSMLGLPVMAVQAAIADKEKEGPKFVATTSIGRKQQLLQNQQQQFHQQHLLQQSIVANSVDRPTPPFRQPDPTELCYDDISSSEVNSWSFDSIAIEARIGGHLLSRLSMKLLVEQGVVEELGLDRTKLGAFVRRIEDGYVASNPYHNALHVASVLHATHMIIVCAGVADQLSTDAHRRSMVIFAAYMAAILHDFKHNGRSNKFLIDNASPTAIVYNDTSPQENFHSASAFKILLDPRYDFFAESFTQEQARTFRNLVIGMILQTDMLHHFALLTKFRTRLAAAPNWAADDADVALVLQLVLKAADMSHLAYNFDMHTQWVELLQEEMFLQGDHEIRMGLAPSALCDRTKPGITSSQADFIDFVALRMYKMLAEAFPSTSPIYEKVVENHDRWCAIARETQNGASSSSDATSSHTRPSRKWMRMILAKCSFAGRKDGPEK